MGTLANSLFRALLGWIRTLSAEIWNTFSSPEGTTLLSWLGAHWKGLAVLMCLAGLAVDLIVYLFRWQPYRVWQSRRRRRLEENNVSAGEGSIEPETASMPPEKDLNYGEYRRDEMPEGPADLRNNSGEQSDRNRVRLRSEPETEGQVPETIDADGLEAEADPEPEADDPWQAYRRPAERYIRNAYDAESEEELLDAWRRSEERELSTKEKETTTTERFEQAIRPRRRRSVRAMLSDRPEAQVPAPDQLIDRNEAYRQPVYPRSWHENE